MTTTSGKSLKPEPTLVWQTIYWGFLAMFGLGAGELLIAALLVFARR